MCNCAAKPGREKKVYKLHSLLRYEGYRSTPRFVETKSPVGDFSTIKLSNPLKLLCRFFGREPALVPPVMLTALAPSGPVAPAVPPSPPSTTDTAQSAQRDSFKDIYGNVSKEEDSSRDTGSKPKNTESTQGKPRKTNSDDSDEKTAVAVIAAPHVLPLQKAPLTFSLLSIDQPAPEQASDESPTTTGDKSQAATQVSDAGAEAVPIPNLFVQPGQTAASVTVPANERLAFSARLTQPDVTPRPTQALRITAAPPVRFQANIETRTNSGPAAASAAKDPSPNIDPKKAPAPEAVLPAREATYSTAFDLRPTPAPSQPASEPVQAASGRSFAIQDVQAILPEIPKPPASTEILLQLAGKDQSSASVRVVDRSGTVNVTVHATDPELRTSLRANLSDLASQLTGQGYKTEMMKPAVIAADANNQHDSRQSGRDASGQHPQHQFTPDGRPPQQRDRRANSQQWRDELEQETSATPRTPGGKR